MGVNLTAIFPISQFDKRYDKLIEKMENQEYMSIHDYYRATLDEGFPDFGIHKFQWYLNDKKITQRPQLPNVNAELALPQGLVIRFREDGFEIWSSTRAQHAVKHNPIIGQKLIELYKEIGNDFQANACWVIGDDNPIYHSFIKNEDYRLQESKDSCKKSLEDMYTWITEGEYAGCYTIEGYYILELRS